MACNSHTDYDVIVVGSGPAGGMCSYELSQKGLSVLIIEKEKLPRYKVCAGGLTKKAVDIIPEDFQGIIENHTYNVRTTHNCKWEFSKTTPFPIVAMVMRDKFDYFLVQKSLEKGARLLDGTKVNSVEELSDYVVVKTEGGNFKSRVIVGADGVTSHVARRLGLRKHRKLGVAIEGELHPDKEVDVSRYGRSLHLDFHVIPKGYGWIFPKKAHLSVGVFTTLPRIKNLKKYFFEYTRKKGLAGSYNCQSLVGHQIPIGGGVGNEIFNTKRGLVVGDAAGLADPITGEGIYFALRSGKIAADVVSKSLTSDILELNEYSKLINDEIVSDFKYGIYFAAFLYNLGFIAYNLTRKVELVSEGFIKVVIGEYSYRSILTKIPEKLHKLF